MRAAAAPSRLSPAGCCCSHPRGRPQVRWVTTQRGGLDPTLTLWPFLPAAPNPRNPGPGIPLGQVADNSPTLVAEQLQQQETNRIKALAGGPSNRNLPPLRMGHNSFQDAAGKHRVGEMDSGFDAYRRQRSEVPRAMHLSHQGMDISRGPGSSAGQRDGSMRSVQFALSQVQEIMARPSSNAYWSRQNSRLSQHAQQSPADSTLAPDPSDPHSCELAAELRAPPTHTPSRVLNALGPPFLRSCKHQLVQQERVRRAVTRRARGQGGHAASHGRGPHRQGAGGGGLRLRPHQQCPGDQRHL